MREKPSASRTVGVAGDAEGRVRIERQAVIPQIADARTFRSRWIDSVMEARHVVNVVEGNGGICQHRAAAIGRTVEAVVIKGRVLEHLAHLGTGQPHRD
jgi:hypothetical protein